MIDEQIAVETQLNNELENITYQPETTTKENTDSLNKKTVKLLIYVDENGKKYIGAPELTSMNGMESSYVYHYPDGREISLSQNIMIGKPQEVPEGYTSTETRYPDFSDRYPYNSQLGLYEVTDEDISILKESYEQMHPEIEVIIEYQSITTKKIYNSDPNNQIIDNNPNKIYQEDINNNISIELSQMLEKEKENQEYKEHTM